MTDKRQQPRYSPEVRERAVRMVEEHGADHASQWAAIVSISGKIGCSPQTLHNWVAQSERNVGKRAGPSSDERERIKMLERENRELRLGQSALSTSSQFSTPLLELATVKAFGTQKFTELAPLASIGLGNNPELELG
jgi:transposase